MNILETQSSIGKKLYYNGLLTKIMNGYLSRRGIMIQVINITNDNYDHYRPVIAIDSSGNIHIVWYGDISSSISIYQIRYIKSTDGGNTWTNPINITNESYSQFYPAIAIDSYNNIYVVWEGSSVASPTLHQVRFSKSTDGGNTWSNPIDITSGSYPNGSPSLAIDSSNNIHLAFIGESSISPSNFQIRYCKSLDGGNTWSNPVNITNENYDQSEPAIAIDKLGNLHIVWDGENPTNPNYNQIRYSKSTDSGTTWSSPLNITNDSNYVQHEPRIAIDSSNIIYVIWSGECSESPDNFQLRYSKSTDWGNTWNNPAIIINEDNDHGEPSIAIDNSNTIHLVWEGINPANPTGYQIRYSKSTDGCNTWSTPINIPNNRQPQEYPKIAISSNGFKNIVWDGYLSPTTYRQIRFTKIT